MASNENLPQQTKYDFVLFGATGFTGQYAIEEMIRTAQTSQFTWAIAGRNETKLKESLDNAYRSLEKKQEEIPLIVANVNDTSSLTKMCQSAKIILNCVGPYRFYGEPVIKACIESKAHHIDISGEPEFLERIQLIYHKQAEDAGVCIIGSCGYDSIPCEMALQLLRQQFPGDIAYVEMYLTASYGPEGVSANSGTWVSAIHGFAHAKELVHLRKQLLPKRLPKSKFGPPKRSFFYSDIVDGWCLPLPAADKPVALRTMYHNYVEHNTRPFQLNLYAKAFSFLGACKAVIAMVLFSLLASYSFGRNLLEKFPGFFSFGLFSRNGPSRQQIKDTGFVTTFEGIGHENKLENANEDHSTPPDHKIYVKVKGPEPGYITTPICMIQAGLVLLQERDKIRGNGGVYTPGLAFEKTSLIDRLKSNGIDFIYGTPIKITK